MRKFWLITIIAVCVILSSVLVFSMSDKNQKLATDRTVITNKEQVENKDVVPSKVEPAKPKTTTPEVRTKATNSGTYTLLLNDQLWLNDRFSIQFTEVYEDSRCGGDVQCFWAGQSIIGIELNDNQTNENVSEKFTVDGESKKLSLSAKDGIMMQVEVEAQDLIYKASENSSQPVINQAVISIKL